MPALPGILRSKRDQRASAKETQVRVHIMHAHIHLPTRDVDPQRVRPW